MSDVLYHHIVRPCGVYRAGHILDDAREISRRVRIGEVERQVLERCGCIMMHPTADELEDAREIKEA